MSRPWNITRLRSSLKRLLPKRQIFIPATTTGEKIIGGIGKVIFETAWMTGTFGLVSVVISTPVFSVFPEEAFFAIIIVFSCIYMCSIFSAFIIALIRTTRSINQGTLKVINLRYK